MSRYTSRVFEAGRLLYTRLAVADLFPVHAVTSKRPQVTFGDEYPDRGAEKICVVANGVGDDAAQEWARMGKPGRDERFTLTVVGRTLVPAPKQTYLDIWNRCEALADVVQDQLYDRVTTLKPIPLGFDGEVAIGHCLTPLVDVVPTPEGPMGWFSIAVRLQAQI